MSDIPVIENTISTLSSDMLAKLDQTMMRLDIFGEAKYKDLMMMFLLQKLLEDDNISEEHKLMLNMKLLQLKNIKIY